MYSAFQLVKKYLHYYLTASNGKGHGIHSPFVYEFTDKVLNDRKRYDCYIDIERQRQLLLHDQTVIEVEDLGAGSSVMRSSKRSIKNIASSSLKPKKYAQLLHRIVQYYKPVTILELGTSLGITTAYLAKGNNAAKVITCEGSAAIAGAAKRNFDELNIHNIRLVQGNFADTLSPLLKEIGVADLAFIDGNHREEPTVDYFTELLKHANSSTIFIFDDIHWSKEMESAWQRISQHASVTLTIDLFFIGLVFINPDFKIKQHFTVRF